MILLTDLIYPRTSTDSIAFTQLKGILMQTSFETLESLRRADSCDISLVEIFGYLSCRAFEKFHRSVRVPKAIKRFNFSIPPTLKWNFNAGSFGSRKRSQSILNNSDLQCLKWIYAQFNSNHLGDCELCWEFWMFPLEGASPSLRTTPDLKTRTKPR